MFSWTIGIFSFRGVHITLHVRGHPSISPATVSNVTSISKIVKSKLERKIAKQPMRISKNRPTVLKTNLSGFKMYRSFVCAVRFDAA